MAVTLKITGLSLSLGGRQVLKDLSLECPPGLTVLLGANGAGKTSLLKTILGFYRPDQGEIQAGGRPLNRMSDRERAKLFSYAPQECAKVGCAVREFVVMGRNPYLKLWQAPGKQEYEKAWKAMESCGISHLSERAAETLSGGELRLCYLARARVQEAEWMILDEPESGLDFGRRHLFLEELKKYLTREKKNAMMSVHDPGLADAYGDRIVLMKDGKILDCIDRTGENYESRMTEGLRKLYGRQAGWIQEAGSHAVIWRGDREC